MQRVANSLVLMSRLGTARGARWRIHTPFQSGFLITSVYLSCYLATAQHRLSYVAVRRRQALLPTRHPNQLHASSGCATSCGVSSSTSAKVVLRSHLPFLRCRRTCCTGTGLVRGRRCLLLESLCRTRGSKLGNLCMPSGLTLLDASERFGNSACRFLTRGIAHTPSRVRHTARSEYQRR